MNVFDLLRLAMDDAVGNRGAVRNCEAVLSSRQEAEREVDRACDRIGGGRPQELERPA